MGVSEATNRITGDVLDAAIKVHSYFGPGLYERIYERALAIELRKRGHVVRQQLAVPVLYEEEPLGIGYRIDLVVDDRVVVELKAVESLSRLHFAQVLTYLRLTKLEIGLLMNFNATALAPNVKRIVLSPTASATNDALDARTAG